MAIKKQKAIQVNLHLLQQLSGQNIFLVSDKNYKWLQIAYPLDRLVVNKQEYLKQFKVRPDKWPLENGLPGIWILFHQVVRRLFVSGKCPNNCLNLLLKGLLCKFSFFLQQNL